ncbi:MAG TPA: hypothetical protein VK864_12545, partial [Longimicrobiales bacterium]|nr:hypothetical protein [Longimicrobiales bacterium]
DRERATLLSGWNPYGGEGGQLLSEIADDFRAKYGHLAGLEVVGPGVYHGGYYVIAVRHPFVFDRGLLPGTHLGISVHASIRGALPPEFAEGTRQLSYVWASLHYEQFVDRCADQIRAQLGRPDMTREELLSALVGRPFREHVQHCRSMVREGRLEPFE